MLEFKDNPRELMWALDRFLSVYYGDRQIEYEPNLDEIAIWNIPQALKNLYSFVGKYPGKYGVISSQDVLYINSGKGKTYGGKIIIVCENNGCWACYTDTEGEDPPVWTEDYGWKDNFPKWKLVNNSLSQFLVTFCMKEAIFASKYLYGGNFKSMIPCLKQQGYDVLSLWQGRYMREDYYEDYFDDLEENYFNEIEKFSSFYAVEDAILISDGWCGTNYKNANRLLKSIAPDSTKINMNESLLKARTAQ